MLKTNNYSELATKYSKSPIKGTGYLAFRDLPKIITNNLYKKSQNRFLDFGCGTGRSTRFIKELGIENVTGVDQSIDMINLASSYNDNCKYIHIENNILPFQDNYFDYVISTFVILEISSMKEMLEIFNAIHRILKPGGYFTFLTNSEYLYSKTWLSNSTKYDKNKVFKNGEKVKIYLKNIDQELYDYYWDDCSYRSVLNQSNFSSIACHLPIGHPNDPYKWLDEKNYPPFAIYTGVKPYS